MKRFPIIKAEGTNYDVGQVIGKQLKNPIEELLEKNRKLFAKNLQVYLTRSKLCLTLTQKYFPQYVKELEGIAKGAGVSFPELFLSNNREVAEFNPRLIGTNHCTIIAIPKNNSYLLGHNEDWGQDFLSHLYILDAEIDGTKIFGLNYANNVIGDSVAVNGYGLVQAVNELSHQDSQLGVPKKFIARAILDCKTLEETENLMKTIPRAAGYNHALVQNNRLWNIESSAKEYKIEKISQEKYIHTNHYLTELKKIDTQTNPETHLRYNKAKRLLPKIEAIDDIKRVLSDKSEPPICRENTIGSFIFNAETKEAYIAYGRPSPDMYYQIKYAKRSR